MFYKLLETYASRRPEVRLVILSMIVAYCLILAGFIINLFHN